MNGGFASHPVLVKVRKNHNVTEDELETMTKLILGVDDRANLKHLAANSPETRNSLLYTLRGIIGLDGEAVNDAFHAFTHRHPHLSAQQVHFLTLLKNLIAKNGGLEIDRLYDEPYRPRQAHEQNIRVRRPQAAHPTTPEKTRNVAVASPVGK